MRAIQIFRFDSIGLNMQKILPLWLTMVGCIIHSSIGLTFAVIKIGQAMKKEETQKGLTVTGNHIRRRRHSSSQRCSRWDRKCNGVHGWRFRRCRRGVYCFGYCRDCIWQPMLAMTVLLALLIVIPNGGWRAIVGAITPDNGTLVEQVVEDLNDQASAGSNNLPEAAKEIPSGEIIPLRHDF